MAGNAKGQHMVRLQQERRERNRLLEERCLCAVGIKPSQLLGGSEGPLSIPYSASCPIRHEKSKVRALLHLKKVNELWPYDKEDETAKHPSGPHTHREAQTR